MSRSELDRYARHEIDEYIRAQAPDYRATLEQVRAVIKMVARIVPNAPATRSPFPVLRRTSSPCSLPRATAACTP